MAENKSPEHYKLEPGGIENSGVYYPKDWPDIGSLVLQHIHFKRLASNDPSTTVGAAIYRPRLTPHGKPAIDHLGEGYNRFAHAASETKERLENRDIKYPYVLHAETAAITQAAKLGNKTDGAEMAVTLCPCPDCASMAHEAGVKVIKIDAGFMHNNMITYERMMPLFRKSADQLDNAGVKWEMVNPDDSFHNSDLADTAKFRQKMLESVPKEPAYKADDWLKTNFNSKDELTHNDMAAIDAMQAVVAALEARNKTELAHLPEHGAALFDRNQPHSDPIVRLSRPPLCTQGMNSARDDIDRSLHPEQILIANCAKEGVATEGKSLYLTHHPLDRGAVMLIGSGINDIVVDYHSIPHNIDQKTADSLYASQVMLAEAGISVTFLNAPIGINPFEEIRQAASDQLTEVLKPIEAHIFELPSREVSKASLMGSTAIERAHNHAACA